MRKTLPFALAAALLCFAACDDDDNNQNTPSPDTDGMTADMGSQMDVAADAAGPNNGTMPAECTPACSTGERCDDGTCVTFDLTTWTSKDISAPDCSVFSVNVSPSGKRLTTLQRECGSGFEGFLTKVWDVESAQLLKTFEWNAGTAFVTDDRVLIASKEDSDTAVQVWDLDTDTMVRTLGGRIGTTSSFEYLSGMVVSPDGAWLASGEGGDPSNDKFLRVWNLDSGDEWSSNIGPTGMGSVLFSPDGARILGYGKTPGADTFQIFIWDAATHEALTPFIVYRSGPASFSKDGSKLLTVGGEVTASGRTMWLDTLDAQTGTSLDRKEYESTALGGARFHPLDDGFIAFGQVIIGDTRESRIEIVDTENYEAVWSTSVDRSIGGFSLSDDGRVLAHGDGQTIRVWTN